MADKDFMEIVRDAQLNNFMGRNGGFTNARKKTKCNQCGREMESPAWENPPFYCWRCSDKHEIGNPIIY